MAVLERNSIAIQNREAIPSVLNNPAVLDGVVKESVAVLSILTTDSNTSTFRAFPIPSNARVSSIKLSCSDSGASGTIDVGFAYSIEDGGAIVIVDVLQDGQVTTTALVDKEILLGNDITSTMSEQYLWEMLLLTEDPQKDFDLIVTQTAAVAADMDVVLKATYVR